MKVIRGLNNVPVFETAVVTVGNFDGVHRGHQRIAKVGRDLADRKGSCLIALTFEPHPLRSLTPDRAPQRLTLEPRKLAYLDDAGFDIAVVAQSTPELLGMPAADFLREVIVNRFHPSDMVEGANFGFGRGRQGSVETLKAYGAEHGYVVHVVEPVQGANPAGGSERVSSSLVRALLLEGHAHLAGQALGRPYVLSGTVVRGAGRGRTLGFPTANLAADEQLVPGDGVYATVAVAGGQRYRSAVSIGSTPTFADGGRQIEAHLLDFAGDLYGERLDIHFKRRLREQQRFDSHERLIAQIEDDIARTRQEA